MSAHDARSDMASRTFNNWLGCRLDLPDAGKCDHCHTDGPLIPFVRLSTESDKRYTEADFALLCSNCHFQHAQFRELKPERLPYWFIIAQRIRDYVPPEPEPLPQPKPRKTKLQLDLL